MDPIRLVLSPRRAVHDDHGRPGPAGMPTPEHNGAGTPSPSAHPGSPPSTGGPTGPAVRRTLPERRLTAVGAWCLVEHFGDPDTRPTLLETLAYPEAGLQSLTWPIDGLVRHRDGTGTDTLVRHGHLCLSTAGRGTTVAESGIDDPRGGRHARRFLHGVRLAAALPSAVRDQPPQVHLVEKPPVVTTPSMRSTVIVGALAGYPDQASPAPVHSPLLAADITLATGTERLALDPLYEHGILLLDGQVSVDGTPLHTGDLAYLPVGRERVDLATLPGCQLLVLGGTPYAEEFILWWNMVAASHEEVVDARKDWELGLGRFGPTPPGIRRAAAPPIPPVRLRARRGSLRSR